MRKQSLKFLAGLAATCSALMPTGSNADTINLTCSGGYEFVRKIDIDLTAKTVSLYDDKIDPANVPFTFKYKFSAEIKDDRISWRMLAIKSVQDGFYCVLARYSFNDAAQLNCALYADQKYPSQTSACKIDKSRPKAEKKF